MFHWNTQKKWKLLWEFEMFLVICVSNFMLGTVESFKVKLQPQLSTTVSWAWVEWCFFLLKFIGIGGGETYFWKWVTKCWCVVTVISGGIFTLMELFVSVDHEFGVSFFFHLFFRTLVALASLRNFNEVTRSKRVEVYTIPLELESLTHW